MPRHRDRLIELDIRTLFILAVPSAFLFFGVQLAVWSARRTDATLALWAIGNFIGGCGALFVALRGRLPDLLSIGFANALLVGSLCAVWAGMRRFGGQPVPHALVFGVPAVAFVLLGIVPAIADSYALRTVVTSMMIGAVNLAVAIDLQRCQRQEALRARVFLVWVFGLNALFYFWRAWASRDLAPDSNLLVPDRIVGLTLLIGNLKLAAWNIGALLMANERMQVRLLHAATSDALTKLLNRAGFRDLGERQHQRSRHGQRPLSVLLMDLDRFKSINDRHGHDAGDRALCAFSECALQSLRPTDLLARLGGEEFCALLPDTDATAACEVGERLRSNVAALATRSGGESLRLTVSIGVAQIELPDESVHAALSRADVALYRAKAEGRDRVAMASPRTVATAPLRARAIEPDAPNGGL